MVELGRHEEITIVRTVAMLNKISKTDEIFQATMDFRYNGNVMMAPRPKIASGAADSTRIATMPRYNL
jgi:hypothetical protein